MVLRRHQECERHLEGVVHLVAVQRQRKSTRARCDSRKGSSGCRDSQLARQSGGEARFPPRLRAAQPRAGLRRRLQSCRREMKSARHGREKMCSALNEQHGQLVAFNDRDHHSSQLDRAHRCDGGEYHGIGVVLVVWRDDVWLGEPCRYVERKPFSRGEKIPTRGGGDRGSYHPGHLCAAPQETFLSPLSRRLSISSLR